MTNLAQSTKQKDASQRSGGSDKPRVLVVNKPIRSVRPTDESSSLPVHLAIGVIAGLGGVLTLWLLGLVGFKMGFAASLRTPELTISAGDAIVHALQMLVTIPEAILLSGENRIDVFLLMFALICVPAGGLAAARPRQRGGPPVSALARTFAALAGIAAGLHAIFAVAWIVSPIRGELLRALPQDPAAISSWITDATIASGLDTLLVFSCALWVVLIFRIPAPRWLRALASPATFIGLMFALIGFAASTGLSAQLHLNRSVCILQGNDISPRLILGHTDTQVALLRLDVFPPEPIPDEPDEDAPPPARGQTVVELLDPPERLYVTDQVSIGDLTTVLLGDD